MRSGTILLVMMVLGIATAMERKMDRRGRIWHARDQEPAREVRSTPETRRLDEALQILKKNLDASNSALSFLNESARSMEQLVRNAERSRDQAAHLQDSKVLEIYEQNLDELQKSLQATHLQKAKLVAQRDHLKAQQLTLETQRRLIIEGDPAAAQRVFEERPSPIDQMDQVNEPQPEPKPSRCASSVIVLR
jgi:hypothetical protein